MNATNPVSRRPRWRWIVAGALVGLPLHAHHSFAPFDQTRISVFTGVVTRVNPDANHLQIYFAPMNEGRTNVLRNAADEPVIWEVEMAGSAAAAVEGVSVASFPRGAVFSVSLHPARNGDPKGLRRGPMFRCPDRTPPSPGKHCDSVPGSVAIGQGGLVAPTD